MIGAAGYGGALGAGIVQRHPGLELTAVTARSDAGRRHDELYPIHRIGLVMDEFDPDRVAELADSALVAYPHKAAAGAVRELRARGLKVVDFSADFRLGQDAYEHWYQPHEAPELLGEAVYGLPEINGHRDQIREAELVAGPGCNSTAALLGLWPLRDHLRDAVVDIKTGVSGAGREATQETHYVSASDNVNAYKTEGHRHQAELEQELPAGVGITFVPHLIPVDQGLLATNYALTDGDLTREDVRELLHAAYDGEPFVDVVDSPPHTAHVRGTNRAHVYGTVTGNRVLVESAIDNLWKGAAGQAVQDLNLMLGLDETEGLDR
ncbi:MAG TPA: N-acetyl-gamma-glutamyl-phosphate reductase [Thermoleophilaceae bacterium]|nr:N-acetyl-gamma-glutamyl-phosphate reductase [Thermoleophilaceae bacterium]